MTFNNYNDNNENNNNNKKKQILPLNTIQMNI